MLHRRLIAWVHKDNAGSLHHMWNQICSLQNHSESHTKTILQRITWTVRDKDFFHIFVEGIALHTSNCNNEQQRL